MITDIDKISSYKRGAVSSDISEIPTPSPKGRCKVGKINRYIIRYIPNITYYCE